MSSGWYEHVPADRAITQGDLVEGCPVLEWDSEAIERGGKLETSIRAVSANVIVMTQACDLENSKVDNVLLCPIAPMSDYKTAWTAHEQSQGQNPSTKAWAKHCGNIAEGFTWNLSMLAAPLQDGGEPFVVDFHEVYTVPRRFLDTYIHQQNKSRLRLLSPYREHLSQAFARFFMRVGLPTRVTKVW